MRPAGGGVDQQVLDAAQVLAVLGGPPHHDLEDLLFLEQVAHLDPGQQRGSGPAYIACLEVDAAALSRSTWIWTVGSADGEDTCSDSIPSTPAIADADRVGLLPQNGEVVAVDAHGDRRRVARRDVVDALARVGDQPLVQAG